MTTTMLKHTTMTKGKVLRLISRGWRPTLGLQSALDTATYTYYEVCVLDKKKAILHGDSYIP